MKHSLPLHRFSHILAMCMIVLVIACWGTGAALAQSLPQSEENQTEDLQSRAQAGDPVAQLAMAQRFHAGDGVLQNYSSAADWAELAAKQGNADAQNLLGRYYSTGLGRAKDPEQALFWIRQAADAGAPEHLFDLGTLLDPDSPKDAASAYEAALKGGHIQAGVSLAVLYQAGRGVEQDYGRAYALYESAAKAGDARAQNNLGLLYARGNGVTQDYEEAAQWFTAAANQGLKQAMSNLGVLYENGFGVPLDEALATELYRRAGQTRAGQTGASPTSADPTTPTGRPHLIYDPRLTALPTIGPDTLPALQRAAQAGDPVAQFQLGWALLSTETPSHADMRQAAALFSAAAGAGHAPAMSNLGVLYFEGMGVPQDYVLGQMWLTRAALSGLPEVDRVIQTYATWPSATQRNQAQARAQSHSTNPPEN